MLRNYPWGTTGLVLKASTALYFDGWAGDCSGWGFCQLSGNADKYVVAIFSPTPESHPNFTNPMVHGPAYAAFAANPATAALKCTACHGANLQGQGIAPSCSQCHAWPLLTQSSSTWTVSVTKAGSGDGVITADVPGIPTISCGSGLATCKFIVPATTPPASVTLAVQAVPGSHFTGWSGACAGPGACVLVVDKDASASATFGLDAVGGTVVDDAGGTVTSATTAVVLQIPPGAVDNPTSFSVAVATNPPPLPPDAPPNTTVYQFEPAGQIFTTPVTVRLPVPSGVTNACIWWQKEYAAAYECIGGQLTGDGFIQTNVSHFSDAFVGPAPSVQTVQGTRINTHVLSAGRLLSSVDGLELDNVVAWLPDANGGYSRFQGSGTANGLFSIPGLPTGSSAVIQVGPGSSNSFHLVATADTNLDLGALLDGRPGLTPVQSTDPMPMDLTVDLSEPYGSGGSIDVFSVDANSWTSWFNVPSGSTSLSLTDLRPPGSNAALNVIDGARDSIVVQQLAGATSGNGFWYRQVRGFGLVSGVSVGPTIPPQLATITLTPQVQGGQVTLDWATAAYQSVLTNTGGPACTFSGQSFSVMAQPGANKVGLTAGQAKRTYLSWSAASAPSISTGLMTFGAAATSDYAQKYGLHWNAAIGCNATVRAPNGNSWLGVGTTIGLFDLYTAPLTAVSLSQPQISPPRNVKINGLPLSVVQPDVADGPVISWDVPALGSPDGYRVIVRHLKSGSNLLETVAVLATMDTSLAIPPGLLVKGESYALMVQALKGGFKVTSPDRLVFPIARGIQNTPWFTISSNQHHIGGQINGLVGSGLVLSATGQPDLTVPAGATGFMFAMPSVTGSAYAVTVAQHPEGQTCKVANGAGTVAGSDVSAVSVFCVPTGNAMGAGAFSWTGAMSFSPDGGTTTVLPSGKVLVAGGMLYDGPTSAAVLYDPATGEFSPTGDMMIARYNHTATLLPNGLVLLVGGVGASGGLYDAEIYDPSKGLFYLTGSTIALRAFHSATLLTNGRVLVVGGYPGITVATTTAELYDPPTGTFLPTGSMTTGRASHRAVPLSNGMVLVAGGQSGGTAESALATAEVYDCVSGTFSPTGTMSAPRSGRPPWLCRMAQRSSRAVWT